MDSPSLILSLSETATSGTCSIAGDEWVSSSQPIFDHLRANMRVFHHHRIIEHGHVCHAAITMAHIKIFAEKRILFTRRFSLVLYANEIRISPPDSIHVFSTAKFLGKNTNGNASTASFAGGLYAIF